MSYLPLSVLPKSFRAGTATVAALSTSVAVSFSSALPDANYRLSFSPLSNLAAVIWGSSKTASGFTLNLSVSTDGSIDWLAVPDN